MPPRSILLTPRHALRRANNPHPPSLCTAQEPSFTLNQALPGMLPLAPSTSLRPILIKLLCARKLNAPILRFALRALERALNTRDEVEVAVERRLGR